MNIAAQLGYRQLQCDKGSIATTMVDYYALPASGAKAWPGRAEANAKTHADKAATVEAALMQDLSNTLALCWPNGLEISPARLHELCEASATA